MAQFDTSSPYTDGYQLTPTRRLDINDNPPLAQTGHAGRGSVRIWISSWVIVLCPFNVPFVLNTASSPGRRPDSKKAFRL